MEIRELDLAAFGPFSGRLLDFSPSGGGLHIVYGPNEAGKSSSLRGLKALLFGIPARTGDNFLHDNKELRVGGRLRRGDGGELAVVRRKGNKNTLLSADGGQLDDAVLAPFLHGVNAEIFEMLFGIDHQALVRGGREILEQKGEVGQALFAAAMGSAALHGVLEQLEREADDLFKPRGSTQAINAALREHARLQKAIKEQSLASRVWDDARRALERTDKDLAQVQEDLARCKVERSRLHRIQRASPKIAARRDLLRRLAALGSVVLLAEDFGERRQAATLELGKARATANSAGANLAGLQEQVAAIAVRAEVLQRGETIEALHARLGGHRKAMQDRPHLEAERNQLAADALSLLKAVRPELRLADAETLRPVMTQRVRIAELGNQREVLTERETQAGKALRAAETKLQRTRAEREALVEGAAPEALRTQAALARRQGDLEEALHAERGESEALEQACRDDLSRLGALWRGALDDVPGLPLPASTSVERFEQQFAALEQRVGRLMDKQREYADAGNEAQRELDAIQHAGAVPAERDLLAIRAERDRAWGLLRRQWLDGEAVAAEARELDPERALPEAFESRLVAADEVADRLRREAGQVQRQASLRAALAAAGTRAEEVDGQLQACTLEGQRLEAEWQALWAPLAVKPLPPREMRSWLDNTERLQARIGQLTEHRRRGAELEIRLDGHRQALRRELAALGVTVAASASFETLLVESEATVNRVEGLARQRQTLDAALKTLEQELATARSEVQEAGAAFETWKGQWQTVVGDLGLGADALPSEVSAMLENIRGLFTKLAEAEKLRLRIEGIDTDARAFRKEVAEVAAGVAPEFAALPAEEAIARLTKLFGETRQEDARRRQLETQIRQARQHIREAEATRKTMSERLDALCREAQCEDAAELEPAERRSGEFRTLKHRIDALEQDLRAIAEGMPLADLELAADASSPDTLAGEIEMLSGRIDAELEPRKTALAMTKGEQRKVLELMDGGDHAAALADEAQSVLVGIRSQAEQYVRVKLASRILRDEIERYRRQHQGPLLERASEHFAALTQGSFASLRADFNDKDEPVLVGVRPDDRRVYVEGMSSGTRDQLYLALRLASLEKYMESAEPMPFIVDDILVHFDDERSRATLGVLAQLAGKTQIILFTHHRRLVEQAQGLDTAAPVMVHEL